MPTPELNAFTRLLLRLRNAVDYPLRQNLRLQRGGLKLYRNPEAELFASYNGPRRTAAQSLAARLIQQYHLQDFRADSSPVNFRENLFPRPFLCIQPAETVCVTRLARAAARQQRRRCPLCPRKRGHIQPAASVFDFQLQHFVPP